MPATNVARLWTSAVTKSTNVPQRPTTRFPPVGTPDLRVMSESYEDVRADQLMEMKDREEKYWDRGGTGSVDS